MSQPTLSAEPRDVVGKKVNRLRREGMVPGVVYGPVLDGTVQVAVEERAFAKFYSTFGQATLFELTCGDQAWQVFVRDVQTHPVRWTPVHIDFFAPNLKKEITASVPLALVNVPEGPGIFNQQLAEITVSGLPTAIPSRIQVDCASLTEIGDAVRVADLPAIDGIAFVTNEDEIIGMLAPRAVEEPEAVAEEAEVEGAEPGPAAAEPEAAEPESDGEAE